MNDDSSSVPDAGTSDEPALTQRNTATVHAEKDLSAGAAAANDSASSSSGHHDAAPTYGPAGNTTDAEEEGAG